VAYYLARLLVAWRRGREGKTVEKNPNSIRSGRDSLQVNTLAS